MRRRRWFIGALLGGLPFERMGSEVFSAYCDGAARAGTAIRLPFGLEWMAGDAQVISAVPLTKVPVSMSKVNALEIQPDHSSGVIDVGLLWPAVVAYRQRVPGVPVGVALTVDHLSENLSIALEAALDFVTLSAMPTETGPGRMRSDFRISPCWRRRWKPYGH